MALHNSMWTGSTTNPVLFAQDARLAQAGLLTLNGPGPLDVRQGIMYAPGGPLNVTGTSSTSPWQYSIAAGTFVASKGNVDGPHVGTNDGVTIIPTIIPPVSNSRYDLIYAQQQDADATISADASTVPVLGVVNGAVSATPAVPALPAGATALATALINSSATGGTSGAGVTIDNSASRYTTVRGAPIPVRNATERAELTVRDGLQVYRLDLHSVETYSNTVWRTGDDTGWLPLVGISTSWNAPAGGSAATARRISNRVYMTGLQRSNSGSIAIGTQAGFASLPSGMYPPNGYYGWAVGWINGGTDVTVEINITNAGLIYATNTSILTGIRFFNISFLMD